MVSYKSSRYLLFLVCLEKEGLGNIHIYLKIEHPINIMKVQSVLVGGWEFTKEDGIDEEISKFADEKIVLIPDASNYPEKQVARAVETYKKYDVGVVLLDKNAEKIPEGIKVVYLGGGVPEKLMKYFESHKNLLEDIKEKWLKREIILCGSSTGAMVQFEKMLA
jgi:peptidase E